MENIKKYNSQTKAQLLERIHQLEEMNGKLQQTIDQKIKDSRKEEQLSMRRIKLSAMGQMAAAIAHQWRQPLTSISFILQNISSDFGDGKLEELQLEKSINDAMRLIQQMSTVIDDLREFVKPAKTKKSFDLIAGIKDTLLILQAQLQHYEIICDFNHESISSFEFPGFPEEFKQVLINIMNNAMSAIKRRITQGDLSHQKGKIRIEVLRRDKQIFITIHNNGFPIPDNTMNRIFEPFYTSEHSSKGKGVGLYMAKVIIEENMGGKIMVHNVKDGVTFIIQLDDKDLGAADEPQTP